MDYWKTISQVFYSYIHPICPIQFVPSNMSHPICPKLLISIYQVAHDYILIIQTSLGILNIFKERSEKFSSVLGLLKWQQRSHTMVGYELNNREDVRNDKTIWILESEFRNFGIWIWECQNGIQIFLMVSCRNGENQPSRGRREQRLRWEEISKEIPIRELPSNCH